MDSVEWVERASLQRRTEAYGIQQHTETYRSIPKLANKVFILDISIPEQPKDRIDMPHKRCHNTASIGLHTPRKSRLEASQNNQNTIWDEVILNNLKESQNWNRKLEPKHSCRIRSEPRSTVLRVSLRYLGLLVKGRATSICAKSMSPCHIQLDTD